MIAKLAPTENSAVMTEAAAPSRTALAKRRKGRPVSGENDVGRERLLAATEKLLRVLPPARVTIARIAQEAKVDPALVRYYFGNRAALLVAVVDRVTAHSDRREDAMDAPVVALASHIAQSVQVVRRAPFLHRLIIDELAQDGTEDGRGRVREMNLDLVAFYREVFRADGGRELVAADPLFLYVAVLGASDFFSSAEPLIREMVPDGTDMTELTAGFQEFMVKLVLDGLLKR